METWTAMKQEKTARALVAILQRPLTATRSRDRNMNDDCEVIPRTAAEISEEELQEMMRKAIFYGMRADIAERALARWDQVEDMLAVLREEMPDLLKIFGL
jgi:hypothetical protein